MNTMKNYTGSISMRGLIKSFKNAFHGFRILMRSEHNLYIQLFCAMIITVAGFYFSISSIEWMFQTLIIGLVIFSELVNTAIEKIMDMIHPEYDKRVGEIKDLAASTVLFMVIVSVVIALIIYIPYLN